MNKEDCDVFDKLPDLKNFKRPENGPILYHWSYY